MRSMAAATGNLTTAEASSYQSVSDFSISPCGNWATYTVTRGRMIDGPHGDGGKDLVLLALTGDGGRLELLTGCSALSTAIWTTAEDGSSHPIVRSGREMLLFTDLSMVAPEAVAVRTLIELPAGSGAAAESFGGSTVCCGDTIVYDTSSGHTKPAEGRSFIRALSVAKVLAGSVRASWLIYESPPGLHVGNICLDSTATTVAFTQTSELAHHNDILTLSVSDPAQPVLVGCEVRATYGSNGLAFAGDGELIYKGNCPTVASDYVAEEYTGDTLPPATHGLHRLNVRGNSSAASSTSSSASTLIPVCGDSTGSTEIGSFCLPPMERRHLWPLDLTPRPLWSTHSGSSISRLVNLSRCSRLQT